MTYDPEDQNDKEGVKGWELSEFLPDDEEIFTLDGADSEAPQRSSFFEDLRLSHQKTEVEEAMQKQNEYRRVLARNRQKILTAQKHVVRQRVALHEAYLTKQAALSQPLPALGRDEILVVRSGALLEARTADHQSTAVNWGTIMTGYEWGVEYTLDHETFSLVERQEYLKRLYEHRVHLLDTEEELLELLADACKDERPEMAEAVKEYRNRFRARYSVETGEPLEPTDRGRVIAEKMLRSFLLSIRYDFPELDLKIRVAHPIEEVAYHLNAIVTRTDTATAVNIIIDRLSESIAALNKCIVVERERLPETLKNYEVTQLSWKEKLRRLDQDGQTATRVFMDFERLEDMYTAWQHAPTFTRLTTNPVTLLPLPDRTLLASELFSALLSPADVQRIVSGL